MVTTTMKASEFTHLKEPRSMAAIAASADMIYRVALLSVLAVQGKEMEVEMGQGPMTFPSGDASTNKVVHVS